MRNAIKLILVVTVIQIFSANAYSESVSYICESKGKISIRAKCPRGSTTFKDLAAFLGDKTLHKGTTLRGFYSASMTVLTLSGGNNVMYDALSFGRSLSEVPTAHYIAYNETPPSECPGSVEQPEASAGHLCVYEDGRLNISSANVTTTAGESSTTFGAFVNATATSTGLASIRGTWAVTAP